MLHFWRTSAKTSLQQPTQPEPTDQFHVNQLGLGEERKMRIPI